MEVTLHAISSISLDINDRIKASWDEDTELKAIIQSL